MIKLVLKIFKKMLVNIIILKFKNLLKELGKLD